MVKFILKDTLVYQNIFVFNKTTVIIFVIEYYYYYIYY